MNINDAVASVHLIRCIFGLTTVQLPDELCAGDALLHLSQPQAVNLIHTVELQM